MNERVTSENEKNEESAEAKEDEETESKPYQVVFPNTFLDLLYMAFNILESSVERVSEARNKMAKLYGSEPFHMDIQIIHMELLFNLTRVLTKLESGKVTSEMIINLDKTKSSSTISRSELKNIKPTQDTSWTADIVKRYNKLPLTRAFLLMHKTQTEETTKETEQRNLQVRV